MLAAECEPYAKTGGLADVVDALSRALGGLGHEVDVYLPFYRGLKPPAGPLDRVTVTVPVPRAAATAGAGGDEHVPVGIVSGRADGYRLRLVEHAPSFDRANYYGEDGDYPDNAARFALLARAALETIRRDGAPVDMIHGHDWHAGPVFLSLGSRYATDPLLGGVPTMLTVHNLAYHGWVPRERAWALDLPKGAGKADGVDLLREAVLRADLVNTVSPTYAKESRTPRFGAGLDPDLTARGDRYLGILNGLDAALWDPETDDALAERFSRADTSGKAACKADLAARHGIDLASPPDGIAGASGGGAGTHGGSGGGRAPAAVAGGAPGIPWDERGAPIFGMVGRLDPQKGFDMLTGAAEELVALGARLVVLGTGDARLLEGLRRSASDHPGRIVILEKFDRAESRRIYAGSDLLLMPSRFEPCGQSQMIALRYGTVPLVRSTVGLADTIVDADGDRGGGNGFSFEPDDASALVGAASRAIAAYRDRARWRELMDRGMAADFSWTAHSAPEYLDAYARAAALRAQA